MKPGYMRDSTRGTFFIVIYTHAYIYIYIYIYIILIYSILDEITWIELSLWKYELRQGFKKGEIS